MHHYLSHGYRLRSPIPLPELIETDSGDADIVVRFADWEGVPEAFEPPQRCYAATREETRMYFPDVAEVTIEGGREITIRPEPGVEDRILRLFILGPALGILLAQRGDSVFHASAVAIDAKAVAFMGLKGAGKSTMAATLHERGHPMITDDVLTYRIDADAPEVQPGFPQFKLWPASVVAIGRETENLPKIHPLAEKRAHRVGADAIINKPTRLAGVYLLELGEKVEIERMKPSNALIQLMPHWYGTRWGMKLLKALGVDEHFRQCSHLVQHVPVYALRRPESLELMSEIADRVEAHVANADD